MATPPNTITLAAPKRIVTAYGFWIFLLSDIVMFSCFFAAYAVLVGQTAQHRLERTPPGEAVARTPAYLVQGRLTAGEGGGEGTPGLGQAHGPGHAPQRAI